GVIAPALVEQQLAGRDHAALDQPAERDARLLAPGADVDGGRIGGRDGGDSLARAPRIVRIALDADPAPAQLLGHRARRTGAEERVQHHVAESGCGKNRTMEKGFGLLSRMDLAAVSVAQTLGPVA